MCHFTYSPNEQRERHFRKSLIISYKIDALQLNFLELLYYYLLLTHERLIKLKLISEKCLLL